MPKPVLEIGYLLLWQHRADLMEYSKIAFDVRYSGVEYHIETYPAQYKNLMELVKDKIYPDGFGECGGMGRCGTCIAFLPGENKLPQVGNEATTLSRMDLHHSNVRLCCQVPIDHSLKDLTISILEDY